MKGLGARIPCLVAAVACLVALLLVQSAAGFNVPDQFGLTINPGKQWGRWPVQNGKATITYATKSEDLRAPLRAAAAAWNGAGAHVLFREVTWKRARLRVYRAHKVLHGEPCGTTDAPVTFKFDSRTGQPRSPGTITHGKILIAGRCGEVSLTEDEDFEQWVLAHELGHALGLDHEVGRCTVMAPSLPTDRRSPHGCRELTGKWFCGLISRDDAAGARWLYGGRVRNPTRYCLLYSELARLPQRIRVSVTGDLHGSYAISSQSWGWSAEATLVRRKITNEPSLVYEVEGGTVSWSTNGTGPEWTIDPAAKEDPNKQENLDCSYRGESIVGLAPGEEALTIGVGPDSARYEADAYQFTEVSVKGECAAGEFEGSRPLNGAVEAPTWLKTGRQHGSILGDGLRGSSPLEPSGDFSSGGGSVTWTMTAAK
ncbi:MAG TPA: matrixin family metalloprotease [Solirubrobacterales bacterium]